MQLARRLKGVVPSATLTLNQKANEMAAAGLDVVGLTAGEPDFPTPPHVVEAITRSLASGRTRYTAVGGTAEVKAAISAHYEKSGLRYSANEIVVSTGAKQALFNALLCLVDDGDEGVVVAPYWLSYADMIRVAGGTVVTVETEEARGFLAGPVDLERAITPRTRVVILNSPSNPAGAVYARDDLLALAEVIRRHRDITVVADEIYDRFAYGEAACPSLLGAAPDLANRTVVINGCSKTYAMTGLRLGWAAGPRDLISAMTKLQSQSTSNACAPVQDGAIAALTGDQRSVDEMIAAFDTRRKFVVGRLRALPGVTCFDPRGAFYAFPNLSSYVGRSLPDGSEIHDAFAVTGYLLHEHSLVVVPGGPFGAPNHIRLSFATDMDTLARGLDRLRAGLAAIR